MVNNFGNGKKLRLSTTLRLKPEQGMMSRFSSYASHLGQATAHLSPKLLPSSGSSSIRLRTSCRCKRQDRPSWSPRKESVKAARVDTPELFSTGLVLTDQALSRPIRPRMLLSPSPILGLQLGQVGSLVALDSQSDLLARHSNIEPRLAVE